MTPQTPKIRTCLWYDGTGEDAAQFYISLFPGPEITNIVRPDADGAARATEAMMGMRKIDIAALEAAYRGA